MNFNTRIYIVDNNQQVEATFFVDLKMCFKTFQDFLDDLNLKTKSTFNSEDFALNNHTRGIIIEGLSKVYDFKMFREAFFSENYHGCEHSDEEWKYNFRLL